MRTRRTTRRRAPFVRPDRRKNHGVQTKTETFLFWFFTDHCGIAANRDLAKYTGSTADLCRFARRCWCASARRRIPRRRATIHGLDDGGSRPLNAVGRGLILINPSATDVQNGRGLPCYRKRSAFGFKKSPCQTLICLSDSNPTAIREGPILFFNTKTGDDISRNLLRRDRKRKAELAVNDLFRSF